MLEDESNPVMLLSLFVGNTQIWRAESAQKFELRKKRMSHISSLLVIQMSRSLSQPLPIHQIRYISGHGKTSTY